MPIPAIVQHKIYVFAIPNQLAADALKQQKQHRFPYKIPFNPFYPITTTALQLSCRAVVVRCFLYLSVALAVVFFPSRPHNRPYTKCYKRYAEYLSHIDWQACLEVYLHFLCVFDEETEGENKRKA